MIKEYIQALEDLFGLVAFTGSFEKAQKYFDVIEPALERLEAIENANPSEALVDLEKMTNLAFQVDDEFELDNEFGLYYDKVKKYILKEQEQEKENARSEEILQKYYQEGITLDSVRALKQERDNYKRVLEIIKKKCVDVGYVITLFMYQDYNSKMDELWGDKAPLYYLTKEEFKLLKEVLKDE